VAVSWVGYDDPRSLGERESGGGLALPIWIDAMARMLRGVPVQPLLAPEGLVEVGGDWRYAEWAEGGFASRVGTPAAPPAAAEPASAASAAAR
jgi:penicillin-binding protein 1A